MNLDYVRFICQINHRSELSTSCEIFKSYCFIFYMITFDVGQTAGNNSSNNMSICLLPLRVWSKIHLGISKKDHIFWIPSTKMGLIWERFHNLCFVDLHPCIIFFKWSQLGAHYFSVYSGTSIYRSRNDRFPACTVRHFWSRMKSHINNVIYSRIHRSPNYRL